MKTIWKRYICVGVVLMMNSGCANQSQPNIAAEETAATALSSLSEIQQQQRQQAIAAKDKLFNSLLGELSKSIQTNGIANSIEVCKTRAPELAAATGDELGLRIGRTSFLLRNQNNKPPEWAESFVNDRVPTEVNVALNDGLGVLLPIRLQEACIKCHGQSDSIAKEVAAAIEANYPDDAATGFAVGDMRGYFWIEVPAPGHHQQASSEAPE